MNYLLFIYMFVVDFDFVFVYCCFIYLFIYFFYITFLFIFFSNIQRDIEDEQEINKNNFFYLTSFVLLLN